MHKLTVRKRKEPLLMEFRILNNLGEYVDVEATIRTRSYRLNRKTF
ncbi:hypothetical protein UACE39S_04827 [Ureibacillus acetophenoni]